MPCRRPLRLWIALAGVALAVSAAACGGGAPGDGPSGGGPSAGEDRAAIEDRVVRYLDAYLSGDGEQACAQYTPDRIREADRQAREQGDRSCAQVLSRVSRLLGQELRRRAPARLRGSVLPRLREQLTDREQMRVRLTGDDLALVDFTGQKNRIELKRVGGQWLISETGIEGPPP